MGVYLSKPIKDKASSVHENKYLKCGSSSMQGWRVSQEDAHNCCLDFDSDISLFAVYDGHGGAEVAEYASRLLPNTIKETEAYKQGDYEKALQEAFLNFDATLVTEPVLEELKKIAGAKNKNDVSDKLQLANILPWRLMRETCNKDDTSESETEDEIEEEDDVQGLREEAKMPLADVIARYANGTIPKTPALRRIRGESSKSPFLRARPPSSTSDSEVSSSSGSTAKEGDSANASEACAGGSGSSSEVVTNGLPESNGEVAVESTSEDASAEPSSSAKKSDCDVVSSSSAVNGESPSSAVSSSGRVSAKRAINMYRTLLAAAVAADEESDSDDNDESFCATADTSTVSSDEEEQSETAEENGEVGEGEEELEVEEDSEEDEDDEDDEEEDEDPTKEIDLDEKEEPGNNSGCTAVVSIITRDRVIVANAGDSRAVLCRKGEAVDLSVDHKPEDPIELKRINGAGGRVTPDGRVNGGLNLSRALGDHMYKKNSDLSATEQMITAFPDIKSMDLKEGEDEFVVLACDGIWNSMSSQEVVDFVRPLIAKGESLSEICEKLFDNCLAEDTLGDGTGCDNMTCVIVQLFPHCEVSCSKRKCEIEEGTEDESNKRVKVDSEEVKT